MGPRSHIGEWESLGADNVLLQAIREGVRAPLTSIPKPLDRPCPPKAVVALRNTVQEYLDSGALTPLDEDTTRKTKYWVPVFPRAKKDNENPRLITNLRSLNKCFGTLKHKPDNWRNVEANVQDPKMQWGLTIDMKNWYHHLAIHPSTGRWMRMKLGPEAFQIVGMPFGWSMSPWWAAKLAIPVKKWLNDQGWTHNWWVDDILLLGETHQQVLHRATELVKKLTSLGLKVNIKKSMKEPAQQLTYVGQVLDLCKRTISPLPEKVAIACKSTSHQVKGSRSQPKNLAGLAGTLLDLGKGCTSLLGLPRRLMQLAAMLARKNAKIYNVEVTGPKAWGTTISKPGVLNPLLQTILRALRDPVPKVLPSANGPVLRLRTDASNVAWGAQLSVQEGRRFKEVATCSQRWSTTQAKKHITHREALASCLAVDNMISMMVPGANLTIQADAVSTALSWTKGSKIWGINEPIRARLTTLAKKNISVSGEFLKGELNTRADWLSRNPDPLNYRLDRGMFHKVCNLFNFKPEVDLFASKDNHQLPLYHSWRMDKESLGNAWSSPWDKPSWGNPPWQLIARMLAKIRKEKATVLVCLPVWRSAPWWSLLVKLQATPLYVVRGSLFHNPSGARLPPPRWQILFTVLRG